MVFGSGSVTSSAGLESVMPLGTTHNTPLYSVVVQSIIPASLIRERYFQCSFFAAVRDGWGELDVLQRRHSLLRDPRQRAAVAIEEEHERGRSGPVMVWSMRQVAPYYSARVSGGLGNVSEWMKVLLLVGPDGGCAHGKVLLEECAVGESRVDSEHVLPAVPGDRKYLLYRHAVFPITRDPHTLAADLK
ncbi:hypothetical protein BD779DRAFT_1481968 [Infundibulicybe gibba]|nr:hypothetical protein BD779DRAFT_1481968 [Infundibulicybe gibba]